MPSRPRLRFHRHRSPPLRSAVALIAGSIICACAVGPHGRPGQGRPDLPGGPDWIDLEVSTALFRPPAGSEHLLHVHLSFPRARLLFLADREAGGFTRRAVWDGRVIIRSRHALQVGGGGWVSEVVLEDNELPQDPTVPVRAYRSFTLPAGSYRIEVSVTDRNSIRRGHRSVEIDVPELRVGEPGLSGIEILDPDLLSPGWSQPPLDAEPAVHAREVLPAADTPERADVLAFGCEFYQLGSAGEVICTLLAADGSQASRRTLNVPPGPRLTLRDTLCTAGLAEGTYSLQILVAGIGAGGLQTRRAVRILRPLLARGEDERTTLAQLSLYAPTPTVEVFRNLPADHRRDFLDSLWRDRDPTPGTERNEVREEFIRRLRHADDRWRSGGVRGWESAIGRVYIAFGEPDEMIEQTRSVAAGSVLGSPRELVERKWIYHDPPATFVFIHDPEWGWRLSPESPNRPPGS